jgi:hypothetical protein
MQLVGLSSVDGQTYLGSAISVQCQTNYKFNPSISSLFYVCTSNTSREGIWKASLTNVSCVLDCTTPTLTSECYNLGDVRYVATADHYWSTSALSNCTSIVCTLSDGGTSNSASSIGTSTCGGSAGFVGVPLTGNVSRSSGSVFSSFFSRGSCLSATLNALEG